MRKIACLSVVAGAVLISNAISAQAQNLAQNLQVMPQEPPLGQLREGQSVLVNDNSCPPGQIKKIIGDKMITTATGKAFQRSKTCVQKP